MKSKPQAGPWEPSASASVMTLLGLFCADLRPPTPAWRPLSFRMLCCGLTGRPTLQPALEEGGSLLLVSCYKGCLARSLQQGPRLWD